MSVMSGDEGRSLCECRWRNVDRISGVCMWRVLWFGVAIIAGWRGVSVVVTMAAPVEREHSAVASCIAFLFVFGVQMVFPLFIKQAPQRHVYQVSAEGDVCCPLSKVK